MAQAVTPIPGHGVGPEITRQMARMLGTTGLRWTRVAQPAGDPVHTAIEATIAGTDIRTRNLVGTPSTAEFGRAVTAPLG